MSDLPSYMQQVGDTLIDNGYPIIPIQPGTKLPGRFVAGQWGMHPRWSEHCTRPTRAFELDLWRRWPGCAVAFACGRVVGIDIDVLDTEAAHHIEMLARKMLGDTPLKRIGLAPKRMLVYRASAPFRGFKAHPLEVYGVGNQFVAYAVHPDTGQPYYWPNEAPDAVALAYLPDVTEEACRAFIERAYELVPMHLRPKSLQAVSRGYQGVSGDPRGTYEAVADALEYIPNDDLDGSSWIAVGLAIKAALGEDGQSLWLDWSKGSSKSGASGKRNTAERRWRTMRPTSIGAGTLYKLAQDRGWCPAPDITLNAAKAEAEASVMAGDHPAAAFLELARAPAGGDLAELEHPAASFLASARTPAARAVQGGSEPSHDVLPIGNALLDVEGALGLFVAHCLATAIRPQPFLSLGAAIALIGAVAGRRYRSPTNLRTNVYVAGVCESGGGKDAPMEVARQAADDAGLDRYMGGENIASGSAILTSLAGHPSRLYQIDEIGMFLSSVSTKKAPTYKAEIWSELTKIYSRAKGSYRGTEYANQTLKARVNLQQPNVCLFGTATPSTFWAALEGGALVDGSLARFLVMITDNHRPPRQSEPSQDTTPAALVQMLQDISAGVPGHDYGGNLSASMEATAGITPYVVPYDAAGKIVLAECEAAEDVWAAAVVATPKAAIVNRLTENSIKLALIRAISRSPKAPVIGAVDMRWGWQLAEHCTRTLLREADRYISDNESDAKHKKTLEIIRSYGANGVPRTKLMERTHFLGERRDAVFNALIESGMVTLEKIPTKTKPTLIYRAISSG